MWSNLLLGLLILVAAAFIVVYRGQRRLISLLRREREEIEAEEHRVFDFLHGMGEAFSEDLRSMDLHRLIVEGAAKILDAHGGALYLVDRNATVLVPAFISKGCPPLVEIPPHIKIQADSTPVAIDSFLRLHAIQKNEGILGSVWAAAEPEYLATIERDERLKRLWKASGQIESLMVCPLIYGNQYLGLLAVANGPMSTPFSPSDFEVFKSISEQSAFALYNAIIYSEASEKRRMDHDLHIARDIQRILLPSGSPEIEGFQVCGINIPARQVSGDYFDYIRIDELRFGIAIADVSGKGVPASLIMAMCRSVLRSQAVSNTSAADVLHRVNRQLFPDIKEDMFISMAYVIVNQKTKEVMLSRAGHDAPLLYSHKEDKVIKLNPPGMALGIDSGDVFDRVTGDFPIKMEEDDCLILYTDGVTEALDNNGMEYGMDKVQQAIRASAPLGAPAIIKRLTDDLRNFVGNYPQNDDITLIAIRRI